MLLPNGSDKRVAAEQDISSINYLTFTLSFNIPRSYYDHSFRRIVVAVYPPATTTHMFLDRFLTKHTQI
jgi:hypothetical protein